MTGADGKWWRGWKQPLTHAHSRKRKTASLTFWPKSVWYICTTYDPVCLQKPIQTSSDETFSSTLSYFNKLLFLLPWVMTICPRSYLCLCQDCGIVVSKYIGGCKVVCRGSLAQTREDVRHPQLSLPATAPLKPKRKEKVSHNNHCTTDHDILWAAHSVTPQKATH